MSVAEKSATYLAYRALGLADSLQRFLEAVGREFDKPGSPVRRLPMEAEMLALSAQNCIADLANLARILRGGLS